MDTTNILEFASEMSSLHEHLVLFIKEKAESERNYARSLKKLLALNIFSHQESSLSDILSSLKVYYTHKIDFLTSSADESFKMYRKLKNTFKNKNYKAKGEIEKYRKKKTDNLKVMKQFNKFKEKYFRACKESENNENTRDKFLMCKEIEEDSFKKYARQLVIANNSIKELEDSSLEEFESLEILRINDILDALKLILATDKSFYPKLMSSASEASDNIDKYDAEAEISSVKPRRVSFMKYNISKLYPDSEDENVEQKEFVDSLLTKIWNGELLNESELSEFKDTVKDNCSIRLFCGVLNERRMYSNFYVPEHSFQDLGKLTWIVLDQIAHNCDFEYLQFIIILSQSFNCQEKTFLHTIIKEHPLWKKDRLWLELIQYSANEEIAKFLNCCKFESVDEELARRVRTIFTSQVLTYVHVMNLYEESIQNISDLVNYFKDKYELCQEVTDIVETLNYS